VRALASRRGYREGVPGREVWVLVRRPLPLPGQTEPPELKYYLSNAPADTSLAALLRVVGMRWPIECCFAEGKGELGLDQYELRFWRGWYHHMTLVILAHHFLVRLHQRLMARATATATAAAPPPAAPPAALGEAERAREGGAVTHAERSAATGSAVAPAGGAAPQSA
jgi:hypothetical protein